MEDGEWRIENGVYMNVYKHGFRSSFMSYFIGNGEWGNGEWRIENRELRIEN